MRAQEAKVEVLLYNHEGLGLMRGEGTSPQLLILILYPESREGERRRGGGVQIEERMNFKLIYHILSIILFYNGW